MLAGFVETYFVTCASFSVSQFHYDPNCELWFSAQYNIHKNCDMFIFPYPHLTLFPLMMSQYTIEWLTRFKINCLVNLKFQILHVLFLFISR